MRGQRSEIRGQRPEVRSQKSEDEESQPIDTSFRPPTSDLCPPSREHEIHSLTRSSRESKNPCRAAAAVFDFHRGDDYLKTGRGQFAEIRDVFEAVPSRRVDDVVHREIVRVAGVDAQRVDAQSLRLARR